MTEQNQSYFGISADDLFFFCQGISDMVFLMSVEEGSRFRYYLMNRSAMEFSGLTEEAYGKKFEDVNNPQMAHFLTIKYQQAVTERKPIWYEDSVTLPNGKVSGESVLTPIFNEKGICTHVISLTRDITQRKQFEEKLAYLAYHDDLTGLPNRRLFKDELTKSIAEISDENIAIMFLDLDRFKIVNDTLGHDKGDLLLQIVATRLQLLFRAPSLIARLGGDEFVILLRQFENQDEVSLIAKQILEMIERPIQIDNHEFYVTASIGIAMYSDLDTTADQLMKQADQAMYTAKANGKNNYHYYVKPPETKRIPRLEMEHYLRKAIEREEFILYYQPVYHIITGNITSMEVLIRWQHPTIGMVSPGEFIPIAEETGLIIPIGEWVLRTACRQNKLWQEQGLPKIPIAVNLSPFQFQQQNIIHQVANALIETGLDPRYLVLEVTESMAMQQVDTVIEKLQELKEMGIQISIDDFGTGYSSLSYLRKFPIDSLKIDQSFVREIVDSPDDIAIVKAIIVMARSLKRSVIAEGVETEEQMSLLRELGCKKMQGYLFSKPIPRQQMEVFLQDYA
ncbi:EAL domain-containing protein [Brevibacillus sp. SYSU BS000544]|uniref:sensor domain-containing protein n=1 Tax=Brevibacillus sp. SYSU BS000544 TaxID=3416443 RepID=UPI003CE57AFE